MYTITVLPGNLSLSAAPGAGLLDILRENDLAPESPCGGQGTCGKCRVMIQGEWVRACAVTVESDLTVTLPHRDSLLVMKTEADSSAANPLSPVAAVFDIGTTSVVCNLIRCDNASVLVSEGSSNPQSSFGADVVSRIRAALAGNLTAMTEQIRNCMTLLLSSACRKAQIKPDRIQRVVVVGNPAMQQLFLGISPENLSQIPFRPVLTHGYVQSCGQVIPLCSDAELITVPDISGYVGADTMGCILASRLYRSEEMTLIVDIGTNGEMVMGNRNRMIACATAAGPALEGANIHFGMRACPGAIDHVWLENGEIRFSTIGGREAAGICGSGLIDTVAIFLELGKINARGRIAPECEVDGERRLYINSDIYLTQEDVRQVQLAKGAIRAGIELMARELCISFEAIGKCLLAGAFGSFIDPASACKIGLLPLSLLPRIRAVGNAAVEGAGLIAANPGMLRLTDALVRSTEYLELASLGEFPKAFAEAMRF